MAWFPVGRNNDSGWRLDVVSLLAVLGESLMARHVQSMSASRLCLLPRLIPAPQSFLRSSRALRLPSPPAIVCGVYSGTLIHDLNYFADIIHPIAGLKKYQVAVYNITWANPRFKASPARTDTQYDTRARVTPRNASPINLLTVASSLLTLAAFLWAIMIHDGAAVLALLAMSAASTLMGLASHWTPQLAARPTNAAVPEGDVVIRTRDGAFVIIQCPEEIARALYVGPEECKYLVDHQWFSVLAGFSTLLVIVAVLFLGNCNWTMQAVIAVIYILLNALYWVASLLPQRWLWDLSGYDCREVTPECMKLAHEPSKGGEAPSYTRSLWYAIQVTGQIDWVILSGAAPKTTAWEEWLRTAHANCDNRDWDAVGEKDRLMREVCSELSSQRVRRLREISEEAPAVMPPRRETV